jgi:hypothetical protein
MRQNFRSGYGLKRDRLDRMVMTFNVGAASTRVFNTVQKFKAEIDEESR